MRRSTSTGGSSKTASGDGVSSSRAGKDTCWLFTSAFLNIMKSFCGIGLLTFPFAASLVGLPIFLGGTLIIVLLVRVSMLLLLWTDDALDRSAAAGARPPIPRKRTYPVIVQLALASAQSASGGAMGRVIFWACLLTIVLGQLGTLVGYLQFLGSNLSQLIPSLKLQPAIVVAASIALFPSLIPQMRALSPFSGLGMVSLVSALIAFGIYCGGSPSSSAFSGGGAAAPLKASDVWMESHWSGVFRFAGIALFAAEGITALPSVKYSLAKERRSLANGDIMRLMDVALVIMTFLLIFFGVFGWSCLGPKPPSIVTQGLIGNSAVTGFIKGALTTYILCTYPLQLFPAMEAVEEMMLASTPSAGNNKGRSAGEEEEGGDEGIGSGSSSSGSDDDNENEDGDMRHSGVDSDDERGDDADGDDDGGSGSEPISRTISTSRTSSSDSYLDDGSTTLLSDSDKGGGSGTGAGGTGTVTPRRTLLLAQATGSASAVGNGGRSMPGSGQATPARDVSSSSSPAAANSSSSSSSSASAAHHIPLVASASALIAHALGKPPLAPSASGKDKPAPTRKKPSPSGHGLPPLAPTHKAPSPPSSSSSSVSSASTTRTRLMVWCCGKEILQCCGNTPNNSHSSSGHKRRPPSSSCTIRRGPGKLVFTSLLRAGFVIISAAIASQLKSFGVVISFIGWLAFGVLSFVLPPLMYVRLVPQVFPQHHHPLAIVDGAAAASSTLSKTQPLDLEEGEHWWVWVQRIAGKDMTRVYAGGGAVTGAAKQRTEDEEAGSGKLAAGAKAHAGDNDITGNRIERRACLPPACYSAWCVDCAASPAMASRKSAVPRALWRWERTLLWAYLIIGTLVSIAGMAMVIVEATKDKSAADRVGGGGHS